MHFVTLLHCAAATFSGLHQFATQTLRHRFFATLVCSFAQPAHRQRHAANRTHFDRNLVVSTTDTAGFHFYHRLAVTDCSSKHFERILARLLLDVIKRTIDDVLGDRFLAGQHQDVDKFRNINITEFRIWQNFPFRDFTTTWHFDSFQSSVERGFLDFARSRMPIISTHLLGPTGSDTNSVLLRRKT